MSKVRFEPLRRCEGFNNEDCQNMFEPHKGRLCHVCANKVKQARELKAEQRKRRAERKAA